MQIKRAIWMSVLAYLGSFIVASIVALTAGINLAETQEIPPMLWYTGAVTAIVFAVAFAFWYYQSPKTKPSVKTGVQFGLVMILTGFALDFITFLPLFTHEDPLGPILDYYLSPFFWVTLILILVATAGVGKYLETKAAEPTSATS